MPYTLGNMSVGKNSLISDIVSNISRVYKCCSLNAVNGIAKIYSNRDKILFKYAPLYGVTTYGMLAVKVMYPGSIFESSSNYDVMNALLISSICGSGLYIFGTSHQKKIPLHCRIIYSLYGSSLLCFGSILIWAVLRSVLPINKLIAVVASLSSASLLILIGREYLLQVDKL